MEVSVAVDLATLPSAQRLSSDSAALRQLNQTGDYGPARAPAHRLACA